MKIGEQAALLGGVQVSLVPSEALWPLSFPQVEDLVVEVCFLEPGE